MRVTKLLLRFLKNENRSLVILNWINKTPARNFVKKMMVATHYQMWKRRQNKALYSVTDSKEQTAVDSLLKYGYADVTEFMDPVLLEKTLQKSVALKADVENIAKNQIVQTKDIWVRLTDMEYVSNNTTANIFNRVALQEPVLRIVGEYFGSVPYLVDSLLTFSKGNGRPLSYSQLWHLDYNDTKMLKLFIYLTDMDLDKQGPFMFIDKLKSSLIKRPWLISHLSDELVYSQIGPESVIKMKKKKLTCFMVDTNKCYHAGSRLDIGEERLMLTSMYVDLPSIFPSNCANSVRDTTRDLSPLQKMAITP